jgi:peptidoglycan/LPS O-acetylase OafA/YrhL
MSQDRDVEKATNGWRSGRDPIQRWLRAITTIVVLAVFVYLVVDDNSGTRDLPTLALALGAVLVLLGYEGVVRLPFLSKDDRKDDDERK